MFQQSPRQAVDNIFGFHELNEDLDEEGLQLFLALPILDPYGVPRCMHHTVEYYASEYGWPRCHQPLKDTLRLCQVFQQFYLTAGDRLMREEHDGIMLKELINFLLRACCEEHEGNFVDAEEVACRLIEDVKVWRKDHLLKGQGRPSMEDEALPEEGEPQPSRLSKFWTGATFGSIRRTALGRDRSVSPATTTNDSNVPLKPAPKQILRRLSSVPDRGHQERRFVHVKKTSLAIHGGEEHPEDRGRERKSDVFGFSSIVSTKLSVRR